MNACVYNKATSPKQVVRVVAKPAKQYKVVVQLDCHHRPDIERNITLQYAKHKQQVTLCDYERSHSRWSLMDLPSVKIGFIEAHLKAKEFTVKSPTLNMGCVHWESTRCL